jgi:LysR family transcriptional regulator, glycine cleavage system transcriptional activator
MAVSLIAINAFSAVAQRLSFHRAAEDLGLTQSAVSRHVQGLERSLGVLLIIRHGRSISLTPEGQALFEEVEAGLLRIRHGIETVRSRQLKLRISLLPSYASLWLIPRLDDFQAKYPNIEVQLIPDYRLVDLAANEADIALRYGAGNWPNVAVFPLIEEKFSPVAAPALAASLGTQGFNPDGLTLLDSFEWQPLADVLGLDLSRAVRQPPLRDYNMILQAAIEGRGIAIGRQSLIGRHLAAGQLVPLIDQWTSCGIGYHFLTAPGRRDEPLIRTFRRWIQAEASKKPLPNDDKNSSVVF